VHLSVSRATTRPHGPPIWTASACCTTSGSLLSTTVPDVGVLHHVELWVEDLDVADREWGWLLGRLGYTAGDRTGNGRAWTLGATYLENTGGFEVEPVATA
jgi:hypothetical protein